MPQGVGSSKENNSVTLPDIQERLALLEIDDKAAANLRLYQGLIATQADTIVNEFAHKQVAKQAFPSLSAETSLVDTQDFAQYVQDLFSGDYGLAYVNKRLAIGLQQKEQCVEPKVYLSAIESLRSIISRVLESHIDNDVERQICACNLDKILTFDTSLIFDTYIGSLLSEVEEAKKRTQDYAKTLVKRSKELEQQARIDPLTNIYNIRALQELLPRELLLLKRRNGCVSLVYFDVDKFKQINDSQGHLHGDEVLSHLGKIMRTHTRASDIPCRYGGDEFCLVLIDCDSEDAKQVCDKIISSFAQQFPDYSLSFGIASTDGKQEVDAKSLLRMADQQMYLAKQEPGFQIRVS